MRNKNTGRGAQAGADRWARNRADTASWNGQAPWEPSGENGREKRKSGRNTLYILSVIQSGALVIAAIVIVMLMTGVISRGSEEPESTGTGAVSADVKVGTATEIPVSTAAAATAASAANAAITPSEPTAAAGSGKYDVGDRITFGCYQGEDIEWRVLDRTDEAVLIVSERGLDVQPYNTDLAEVTWETCTLRSWLNDDFYNAAFSGEEQDRILTSTVVNDSNYIYGTDGGNDTLDKIFLLSMDEVREYFPTEEDRMSVPTEYALAQGAYTLDEYTADGEPACWWWLRSPGNYGNSMAFVYVDGAIANGGFYVDASNGCVRPAMWIDPDI